MYKKLKSIFPESLKKRFRSKIFGADGTGIHYSQGGEDIILQSICRSILRIDKGFFIDVGAYHPSIGSNTHVLYKYEGWNGINIDPSPDFKEKFDKYRLRDINLNIGISKEGKPLKYYIIRNNPKMNSFSVDALKENGVFEEVNEIVEVETQPLNKVISKYVPKEQEIDLLNVDAEGFEMEILLSIDWSNKIPKIIIIEQNHVRTLSDVLSSETCKFLESKGYQAIAKNVIVVDVASIIYLHNKFIKK